MLQSSDPKIVIVTRQTRMQALRAKFNTRSMAQFAMVQNRQIELNRPGQAQIADSNPGAVFDELDKEDRAYGSAVQQVRDDLDLRDLGLHVQTIDRDFVPNFVFGPHDIVVTLGQDGLVANTAKYAVGLSIVAVNPEPSRFDGVLLPFKVHEARAAVRAVIAKRAEHREVTLAEVELTDRQRLLAFNDLFIGMKSHVSARYRIQDGARTERQSSSGVLVSTGAGSTGWLSSVFNMAAGVASAFGKGNASISPQTLAWEDPRLLFAVREPFASKTSSARLVAGTIEPGGELIIESLMSGGGVIFSDGIEADFLEFNSGTTARIRSAQRKARLVIP